MATTVLEKRVTRTLNDLHLIGNRAADIESPEQADKVEQAIVGALREAMGRLRKAKAARERPTFSF
jgi:hypothetical protein